MTACIKLIDKEINTADLGNAWWESADPISVSTYWSGEAAPDARHFEARMLWSMSALYVRFECAQDEPLVISDDPDIGAKTIGLWERDVCEIFIAPDAGAPNKYFEFEIAPTGEWLDLAIENVDGRRKTDWDLSSGMTSAATISEESITMAIAVPFDSLGTTPKAGDVWMGNLFRCVGSGATRGYLAWQPTLTEKPNFHVPARFGKFLFD